MNRRLVTGTGLIVALALFLTVNIIANQTLTSLRLDLTENRLYTLSAGSRNILGQLSAFDSSGRKTDASIGVSLTMPLFTGGSVQNRIKETLALEEKSRNDLEAARRSIAQGTRQVFFAVQSGQAQVKALEAAASAQNMKNPAE